MGVAAEVKIKPFYDLFRLKGNKLILHHVLANAKKLCGVFYSSVIVFLRQAAFYLFIF